MLFLIFTTSLVVYLFRHRILARTIVGCFWFILGCVNGFLLLNRVTPFTGPDLKLVVTGKNNANRRAEFSLFPPEESVLISTDGHIISNMDQLGMATLGYIGPGGAENESTGRSTGRCDYRNW